MGAFLGSIFDMMEVIYSRVLAKKRGRRGWAMEIEHNT
jgi:hypothetical protein